MYDLYAWGINHGMQSNNYVTLVVTMTFILVDMGKSQATSYLLTVCAY